MEKYLPTQKFKVSENGTINQTERNQLKTTIQLQVLPLITKELGCDYVTTKDGIILLLPNEEEGCIPVQFDLKIKNLEYDYLTAEKEYQDDLIAKAKAKEEKAKKVAKAKAKQDD